MTDTYVFLGPSLALTQARELLDAHYLPPVSCGDITDLVLDREPPKAIGIIDGLFEQVPTVWHKEILFALSRGVRVFGASSMGALRAAELHTFGMEGVGTVFEAFRDGRYRDDDEVTIVHAAQEDGYRMLSEAMVNLRAGLAGARDAGHISQETHRRLVTAAKDRFYPERSWPQLLRDGEELALPADELDGLRTFVRDTSPDVKRTDARALLVRMRQVLDAGCEPFKAAFDFEPTYYWEKLVTVIRQQRAEDEAQESMGVSSRALLRHLRVQDPDVLDAALLEVLVRQESVRLGLRVPEEGLERQTAAYRDRGLAAPAADALAQRDGLREILATRLQADLPGPVLLELAARAQLATTRAELAVDSPGATRTADHSAAAAAPGAIPIPSGRRE